MSWDNAKTVGERFGSAWQTLAKMFPGRRRPGKTYQGFIKALVKQTPWLQRQVQDQLRRTMQEMAGACWQVAGWLVFAVDGSRFDLPRTEANEGAFGGGGKGGTGPQLWLTTLWHLGLGLPWAWRIGPANASEREHLQQMIQDLPLKSLLVADAGFTGYDLLQGLMQGGRSFLIRVGANVRLLKQLGYAMTEENGIVYLWPDDKRRAHQLPLVLRLICLSQGTKNMYLLTNVLDPKALSQKTAKKLYRMRWGVELYYRTLKQTMDRRKMRSDAPQQALAELNWTIMGLWLLGLMSVKAILMQRGRPQDLSVAQALRHIRAAMRHPRAARGDLMRRLGQAVRDRYRRHGSKQARHWPHKKTDRPPGAPNIRSALESEVQAAQRLPEQKPAA